ncbi:Protein CBG19104 [Caenorhabditis briggsae]|uniref:Protein CBG19104 n=1 Tax=Caenorhabditis briggsae TaxID=6238 RepID=A8XUT2_CAEBR|nr:Protein CBG19104 [Caenorhabditis briggsae]CAP36405.2 Protein CBG19104 [Caenorhabditis briggsae]
MPVVRDEGETKALVYHNDMLMKKIIGDVEKFKDRNSLELTSQRFRLLCLQTPISRRKKYAIRLEADPNWPAVFTLLMRPRKYSSRLSIVTCSADPEDKRQELVSYRYKENKQNAHEFYEGVRKRLLNQIVEFEIKFRRFTIGVLEEIQTFPNLNRIIVKNARNFSAETDDEPEELVVLNRITSLELTLDRQWSSEIARMKRLIGPNLKHFCCYVTPCQSKTQWFIEEIMVEMAIHNVELDLCRLVFPDPQIPRILITALIQFMSERSRIMQVFVSTDSADIIPMNNRAPAVGIQFRDEEDNTLKLLYDACPLIFQQAHTLRISNLHDDNCDQLDILPKLYAMRELQISCTSHKEELSPIDELLLKIPSTVNTLTLNSCKLTSASIDILVSSTFETIQNLHLVQNGSCNTVQNFVKILEGFPNLKTLEMDMVIPHLMFPKIVEHSNLEKLTGFTNRSAPEKSLQIVSSDDLYQGKSTHKFQLRNHFNHVCLKKVDRQNQYLFLAKPIRSQL